LRSPHHRSGVRGPRRSRRETYAKAQPLLKSDAIFCLHTSTLPINSLAEEFKDQGKFIGHPIFFLAGREDDGWWKSSSARTPATSRASQTAPPNYVRANREDADRGPTTSRGLSLRQSLRGCAFSTAERAGKC